MKAKPSGPNRPLGRTRSEPDGPLLARRIPLDTIVIGRAYVIHARNGGVGVAVHDEDQIGYQLHRVKFERHYLDIESDWGNGPPYGTAIPLRALDEVPPKGEAELLPWLGAQQVKYDAEIRAAWEIVLGRPAGRLW